MRSATSAAEVSAASRKRRRHVPLARDVRRPASDRKQERAVGDEDGEPEESFKRIRGRSSLSTEPTTTASTKSASVSVMTVPPPPSPPRGAREPVLLDDRVRDERVRRPQRPVQGRGREAVAERKDEQEPEDERQRERQRAECQRRPAVALELVEVELETGDEHEKQQPSSPSDSTTPSRATQSSTNGPTSIPPRTIPTSPGSRNRSATTGPASRTTAATKNVHSADSGGNSTASRHGSGVSPGRRTRRLGVSRTTRAGRRRRAGARCGRPRCGSRHRFP